MFLLSSVLVALVAAIHVYIMVLEMFLWRSPRARAAFATSPDFAEATSVMAANQGLYNGFLAAGLIAGLVTDDPVGKAFKVFFLVCVAVAGVYGSFTVSRRILIVQTLPAGLALAAVLVG